jgi:hypothetical protein
MAVTATSGLVVTPTTPLGNVTTVALGRELVARVVATGGNGEVTLRVGGGNIQAQTAAPLGAGDLVRLRVSEVADTGKVVLTLVRTDPASAPRADLPLADLLRSRVGPRVGDDRAGALARVLDAKGAPPAEATVLAARTLAGEANPLALVRRLAQGHPALQSLLAAVERELVAGDGKKLRQALTRLGLDHERRSALGLDVTGDLKSLLGKEGGDLVTAQQLLLARDAEGALPLVLSLPLPGHGEAQVTIEQGTRGEGVAPFHVYVELVLEQLGHVGVRVVGHQGAAFVSVHSESADVAEHLRAHAPALEAAVGTALGRPVQVGVAERAPEPPRVATGQADVYA